MYDLSIFRDSARCNRHLRMTDTLSRVCHVALVRPCFVIVGEEELLIPMRRFFGFDLIRFGSVVNFNSRQYFSPMRRFRASFYSMNIQSFSQPNRSPLRSHSDWDSTLIDPFKTLNRVLEL
jgi:hypothetical protein